MPNQRDPEKKHVGFWVSHEELDEIRQLENELGLNRTQLLLALVKNQQNLLRARAKKGVKAFN